MIKRSYIVIICCVFSSIQAARVREVEKKNPIIYVKDYEPITLERSMVYALDQIYNEGKDSRKFALDTLFFKVGYENFIYPNKPEYVPAVEILYRNDGDWVELKWRRKKVRLVYKINK